MNTVPPPLSHSRKRLSRDVIVLICAAVTICVAVIAWCVTEQWQAASKVRKHSQEMVIRNNLRQLGAAADQFFLENNTRKVKLSQIVGPGKYIRQLTPIDGEDYGTLDLNMDVRTWTIVSKSGVTVTHRR